MARPKSKSPTDAELEVLKVIWLLKRGTVRDVHDAVSKKREVAINTLQTLMTTMVQKNILRVVDDRRPQQFEAVETDETTYRGMIRSLADRLFGGSISALVQHSLAGEKASKADRKKIEQLLREMKDKEEQ